MFFIIDYISKASGYFVYTSYNKVLKDNLIFIILKIRVYFIQ